MYIKYCKKIVALFLTIIMVVTVFGGSFVSAETLSEKIVSSDEPVKFEYVAGVDYSEELSRYEESGYSFADIENRISVLAKDFSFKENKIPQFISYEGKNNVFMWDQNTADFSCSISVPVDGLYTFGFEYLAETVTSADILRTIKVDGKAPFEQANSITLPRMWAADGKPTKNSAGDEVRPLMKQLKVWQNTSIYDAKGETAHPFQIYLEKGTHKFEFGFISMAAYISSFFLDTYSEVKPYADVKKNWDSLGYKKSDETLKFEAEKSIVYSNTSTYRMATNGDPMCSPISRGFAVMNIVGAEGGKKTGNAITFKFNAPKDGLYKLAFRVCQNYRDGMPSYKKIEIDGEIPFKEFSEYCFYNSDYWRTEVLSDEKGSPYLVYLTEGEHTLTLSNMLAKYKPMTDIFYADSQKLSNLLLEIRKITGNDIDYNYDYRLDKQIPHLISTLNEILDNMKVLMKMIEDAAQKDTAKYNELKNMVKQVEAIKGDIFRLPRKLKELDTVVTQYSSWIDQFAEAPLDIDYFMICNPEEKIKSKHSGFIQIFYTTIVNFIFSFSKDYDSISDTVGEGSGKTIDVWVSRGTRWGEAIKNLIDSDFSKKYNINVDMNIVPAGQLDAGSVNTLMLSIASGTAPDACLGVSTPSVGEFAMRDVLVDLSGLEGFEKLKSTTYAENYVPNSYKGKVYGIPETMNFAVLIYRRDILADLKIPVPKTWDDVYKTTIPALLQNNMEFYLPLTAGWPIYQTLLFQHGGDIYNKDLTASALDTKEAYNAFIELRDLVTKYGIPTTANFYNRFRSGEMPIGFADMSAYMQIATVAPEIVDRWAIAPLPGRLMEDGSINFVRAGGSETSSVVLKKKDLKLDEVWQFINWWMSTEIQLDFGYTIEAEMGTASRWNSANAEAFMGMAWDRNDLEVIKHSFENIKSEPIVLGGYYTSRYLNTAYNKAAISNEDAREALEVAVEAINEELKRRRNAFEKYQKSN